MSMPRFSAEASLYRASGHYRTGRQALYLPRRTNSLGLAFDEGEIIVVKGCRPGWVKLGEGVCVPDPSLPGGGGSPGTPDEPGGEPPPPGGPRGEPFDKPDKPKPEELLGKAWRVECLKQGNNVQEVHECCVKKSNKCIEGAQAIKSKRLELTCASATDWCKYT